MTEDLVVTVLAASIVAIVLGLLVTLLQAMQADRDLRLWHKRKRVVRLFHERDWPRPEFLLRLHKTLGESTQWRFIVVVRDTSNEPLIFTQATSEEGALDRAVEILTSPRFDHQHLLAILRGANNMHRKEAMLRGWSSRPISNQDEQ